MDERTLFYISAKAFADKLPPTDQAWVMPLWQIREMCRFHKETVAIYDDQGFRKGTVYSDGSLNK